MWHQNCENDIWHMPVKTLMWLNKCIIFISIYMCCSILFVWSTCWCIQTEAHILICRTMEIVAIHHTNYSWLVTPLTVNWYTPGWCRVIMTDRQPLLRGSVRRLNSQGCRIYHSWLATWSSCTFVTSTRCVTAWWDDMTTALPTTPIWEYGPMDQSWQSHVSSYWWIVQDTVDSYAFPVLFVT